MASTPVISIVMPLFRSQEFLRESIDSLIGQTFGDFELIIIVDDAAEETRVILSEYEKADRRIRTYYNDNIGLINSLNMGITRARGKYIARMDTDDICLPARLEKQFSYMETHPETGILGTSFAIIDSGGQTTHVCRPIKNPGLIKWRLVYDNCLTHSSVMIRRSILENIGQYRLDAKFAEDYDLWVRASGITRIANHRDVLMKYRVHDNSVSLVKINDQEATVCKIVHDNIKNLLSYDVTLENCKDLRELVRGNRLNDAGKINTSVKILTDSYAVFLRSNRPGTREISLITNDLMIKIIKAAVKESKISLLARMQLFSRAIGLKLKSCYVIVKQVI